MAADPNDTGTIVVPGRGTVVVSPDVANLRLGVVVVRPTAGDARQAAAAVMTAVVDALVAGGVDRRDLRTSLISLDAVRDYSSERGPRVTGYQLSNAVEATIRQIDTSGALIDAALAAGATSMDGLSFRLADPREALGEARRRAVADARSRAETLATEAGVTLGRVVAIVEGGLAEPGPPRPIGELRMHASADVTTPLEAGTDELAVSLKVTFAIG
jgi:uncharacterized protein YggE